MTRRRLLIAVLISFLSHALAFSLFGTITQGMKEEKNISSIMVELIVKPNELALEIDVRTLTQPSPPEKTLPKASDVLLDKDELADYQHYVRRIRARIEEHWRTQPDVQPVMGNRVTTIRFVIDRSGKLLENALKISSGSAALDLIALKTIEKAAPFEKIPLDLGLPRLEVIASFIHLPSF